MKAPSCTGLNQTGAGGTFICPGPIIHLFKCCPPCPESNAHVSFIFNSLQCMSLIRPLADTKGQLERPCREKYRTKILLSEVGMS